MLQKNSLESELEIFQSAIISLAEKEVDNKCVVGIKDFLHFVRLRQRRWFYRARTHAYVHFTRRDKSPVDEHHAENDENHTNTKNRDTIVVYRKRENKNTNSTVNLST